MNSIKILMVIALSVCSLSAFSQSEQTFNQTSDTLLRNPDTTLAGTGGVFPAGTPGIEISNPTTYPDHSKTPPLFTAEAGREGFGNSWVAIIGLLGLFGLFGRWMYRQGYD